MHEIVILRHGVALFPLVHVERIMSLNHFCGIVCLLEEIPGKALVHSAYALSGVRVEIAHLIVFCYRPGMHHRPCLQSGCHILVDASALLLFLGQQFYSLVEVGSDLSPALLLRIARAVYLIGTLSHRIYYIVYYRHASEPLHHLIISERTYGIHLTFPSVGLPFLELSGITADVFNEVVELMYQSVLIAESVCVVCHGVFGSGTVPLPAQSLACKSCRHAQHPEMVVEIFRAVSEVFYRHFAIYTCHIAFHSSFRTENLFVVDDVQRRHVKVGAGCQTKERDNSDEGFVYLFHI